MRFWAIAALKAQHSVSRLCEVLGVTRQGFHAWRRRAPSRRCREDRRLKELILTAHGESWRTSGAPRIHAELRHQGVSISKKRVARLMRELGIEGVSRRRARTRTVVQA
jgi:putative transposase